MNIDLLNNTPKSQHPSNHFRKRSLNWKILSKWLFNFIINVKDLAQFSKINKDFAERIMLAVTSVNECTYCSYFHTKVALESGCSDEEIRDILEGELSCADKAELPALAFAQHFAESQDDPSREALKHLIKVYGVKKSKKIIAACRMITLGNLFGNTIDAYIHRYHGINPIDGSPFLERFIYYVSAIPIKNIS